MTFIESIGVGVGAGLGFVAVLGAGLYLAVWWFKRMLYRSATPAGLERLYQFVAGAATQIERVRQESQFAGRRVCPAGCLCQGCYQAKGSGSMLCAVCDHKFLADDMRGAG